MVPAVLDHTSRVLTSLSSKDIESAATLTEHALGDVRKQVADSVPEVRDWHPNFALTHVFSFIVEHLGQFPTYEQFRDCAAQPPFDSMLWFPAQEFIRELTASGRHAPAAIRDAMRWRIGNAYYSFMREAYVVAKLREAGLDARSHPLADALFRVDFWCADVNVDLYVGNLRYRAGASGRKPRSEDLLADASPPFRPVRIEMPTASRFGVVHLPDPQALNEAEEKIRALVAAQPPQSM